MYTSCGAIGKVRGPSNSWMDGSILYSSPGGPIMSVCAKLPGCPRQKNDHIGRLWKQLITIHILCLALRRPVAAGVIIKAAQEKMRKSSIKCKKSLQAGGWGGQTSSGLMFRRQLFVSSETNSVKFRSHTWHNLSYLINVGTFVTENR